MYFTLLEKRLRGKAPFHQKVLHFQYEIPLSNLKKAFYDVTSSKGSLFQCNDTLEETPIKTVDKIPFSEEVFQQNGVVCGIFDEYESFYIRLVIDPAENANSNEEVCGNFYLFASDEMIYEIGKHLGCTYGQLVLESTADHFALLAD